MAALRSYPTSPVPVGEVQTKRMVQRRGSNSSMGSAGGITQRPGGLQRQNSSGSMTERTFRSPLPSYGSSPIPNYDDAPPVPALPRTYMSPPPVPVKSTRRPASVEPPERVSSPLPRAAGRGVSLDRGPGTLPPPRQKGGKQRYAGLNNIEPGRVQNRDSVNFSRPMSPQNSPPTSPLRSQEPALVAPPGSGKGGASGLRNGEAENIQHTMQATADRPVKKKKKAVAKGSSEGSHFASGSSGGRPVGTAVDVTPPRQSLSNSSTPSPSGPQTSNPQDGAGVAPRPKKKRAVFPEGDGTQGEGEKPRSSYASDSDTHSERSVSSDRPRKYNTRAAGLLVKQPSVVREDPEAEEQEDQRSPVGKINDQMARNSNSTPAAARLQNESASVQPPAVKSTSLGLPSFSSRAGPEQDLSSVAAARHQSLSPARAAHFSSQPIFETSEGIKHQPPARSVSPAKSALKHSPSSRGPSPAGSVPGAWTRRNGRAASEASDTTSIVSDDGSRGAPKKKKSVRVSFDEDTVVVGRAASPTSPDSPVIMSPQTKGSSNAGWYSGQEKREEASASGLDGAIQPTPALPTFGSVRGLKNESSLNQPINQKNPQLQPNRYETSSDIVVGNILEQHRRGKEQRRSNEPLPPEVTSVEGTGSHSESEDDIHTSTVLTRAGGPSSRSTSTKNANQGSLSLPIPAIAVLPATPGVESPQTEEKDWFRIPGEFPLSTDNLIQEAPTIVEHHATDPTPADIGIAEPEPEFAAANHEAGSAAVGSIADGLRMQIHSIIDEESEDSESIYSDAAEDLSDFEGDGFGSINAIIESPISARSSAPAPPRDVIKEAPATKHRPGPLGRNESELSEPGSDAGWDRAQEYWSGLSQTRKQQLEDAAIPGAADRVSETKAKPKKKATVPRKKTAQSPVSEHPPLPPWPDRQYREETRPSSPRVSAMKQSMRSSQPEPQQDSHMRSSMRNGAVPKSQRYSVDAPQPRGALQKKTRPMSAVAMVDYDKPSNKITAGHGRAASADVKSTLTPVPPSPPVARKKAATPNLRRAKSNDSDSSSSFKRLRPSTADSSRYSMKRSMRGASMDDQSQPLGGNRTSTYSARSPSPSGSTRRPFSAGGSSMRTSMRGQIDSGKQTSMRGSVDSGKRTGTKSPSRFGFGKTTKPKGSGSKGFSSRFGDSSDEDDRPVIRRSRFDDSSDDDGPSGLTPVRGIPRRIDEGDSTDLEDSSAEPSPVISKPDVRPFKTQQGSTLAAGSVRSPSNSFSNTLRPELEAKLAADKEKKKRSFFGGLGGKKRDDTRVQSPTRDTPLERPRAVRIATTDSHNSAAPAAAPSPKSPKLQRRNTPKRFASDSWPLPEIPAKVESRPNTSDGNGLGVRAENGNENRASAGIPRRPDLVTMGSTARVEGPDGTNGAVIGKAGKKKRFPMLRKAFRMID